MRVWSFSRCLLGICAATAMLEGCGGSQQPIGTGVMPERHTVEQARVVVRRIRAPQSSYQLLYSFGVGSSSGEDPARDPAAGVIDVNGTLYGTTANGGPLGGGTVFSISTTGAEQMLYSFGGTVRSDGRSPLANLIDVNGTLYGTTESGGTQRHGTVFSISTTGRENVLFSFGHLRDGAHPFGSLINVAGTLYGTTERGGAHSKGGTVFSVSTSGKERVLHSFGSGSDGRAPFAGLIEVGRRLYGTTSSGGKYGYGTVFSISTTGKEKVLYSFASLPDGRLPRASLINVSGTLYGTTYGGGTFGSQLSGGDGTVFSISKTGKEHVLHSFGSSSDGGHPRARLISVNGTLYGTTYGASISAGCGSGCGTVFSITPAGTETVLHNFSGHPDGRSPLANLIDVNGTLYGTTQLGGEGPCGSSSVGCGTVFTLTP